MTPSLRSLLWTSFAAITLVALVVVAVGLVLALQNNPVLYRQLVLRLNTAEAAILQRIEDAPKVQDRLPERVIQKEAEARQLRVAILDGDGKVLLDFGIKNADPLPSFATPIKTTDGSQNQVLLMADASGKNWFYTMRTLENNRYLMVAIQKPTIPLRTIFRDEVLSPFLQAAGVAIILAFVISLILGYWISKPLHHMAQSARAMANGQYQPIAVTGPREVQQLGEALNEMAHRVQTGLKSQREFVANVSHELKTPVTSIQGFAQAIMDGTAQSQEALQQSARVIYDEASRMHRLVMELLVLARLDAGTADLQRTQVDLAGILKNIVEKFTLQAQNSQISLTHQIPALPVLIGDGDRLSQVFTNLVDNAIKYTPTGGSVNLAASIHQDSVFVSVTDTGIGIAPEDQQRIFERFYQVDKSRRGGTGRGVGLGLAIASQIVQAHHGQIWVESRSGSGSTFFVRLPIPSQHTLEATPKQSGA